MIKLSIIVPVYNVEKYIRKCLDSILSQNISNYEIILVDDGSTDNSGKICDEYGINPKIRVIHQKNKGLSGARNSGIKIAKGEYLMFIDSDDFINYEVKLNRLLKKIDNVDILQYRMLHYFENGKIIHLKSIENDINDYTDTLFYNVQNAILSISACDKIIKRKLIIDNNLFFEENLISEDVDWSLKLYLVSNSIKMVNDEIYVYRQGRIGSISNTVNKKSIDSQLYIIEKWAKYDYKNEIIKNIYLNYLAYCYLILLTLCNSKNTSKENRKKIKQFSFLLKYDANYKVKLANKVFYRIGNKMGVFILKTYLFLKNLGVIKL